MVIRLHKFETWDTAKLIWTFAKFSSVKLLKPKRGHVKRSSFYMIASKVQCQHPGGLQRVIKWKEIWRSAISGSESDLRELIWNEEPCVEDFIVNIGDDLISSGKNFWKIQAGALAKAPFLKCQDK